MSLQLCTFRKPTAAQNAHFVAAGVSDPIHVINLDRDRQDEYNKLCRMTTELLGANRYSHVSRSTAMHTRVIGAPFLTCPPDELSVILLHHRKINIKSFSA